MKEEVMEVKAVAISLKKNLAWGDQRRIADRLKCKPNKVNLALKGWVDDEDFLSSLVAEIQRIQYIRETYSI
jgi:hypothetical protein